MRPQLEALARKYADVHVRGVDIDQNPEILEQSIKDFHWDGGVPYIRVYGKDRTLVGDMISPTIEEVEEMVKKGL